MSCSAGISIASASSAVALIVASLLVAGPGLPPRHAAAVAVEPLYSSDNERQVSYTDVTSGVPPTIYQYPEPTERIYRTDDTFDLLCAASGTPRPQYEWLKNGNPMDLSRSDHIRIVSHGTLRFSGATAFDEGFYQCIASNENGRALSHVVHVKKAVLQYYQSSDSREYRVREGHRLHVECNAPRSLPNATYSWSVARDVDSSPRPVLVGQRVQIDSYGDLYFGNVKQSDMKGDGFLYKCNVFNPYLDLTTTGAYSSIHVLPSSGPSRLKPAILFSSSAIIALENSTISIRCFFSGFPEPTIEWRRSGNALVGGRYHINNYNTELVIHNVQPTDEGVYICKGSNSAGESEQTIYVDVQAVPVFKTSDDQPHDINVTVGDSVTINCRSYAEPPATVTWYQNGHKITPNSMGSNFRVSSDGSALTLKKMCKRTLTSDDNGFISCDSKHDNIPMVIQCNASNEHGYAFANGYINVFAPTVIEDQSVDEELQTYRDVTYPCRATTDRATPLTRRWFRDDEHVYDDPLVYVADNGSLVMLMSQESDGGLSRAGVYRCHVTNGYSSSDIKVRLYVATAEPVIVIRTGSLLDFWWLVVFCCLLVVVLLIVTLSMYCGRRQQAGTYRVDIMERKNGHDPEKDLADQYFQEYTDSPDRADNSRSTVTTTLLSAYRGASLVDDVATSSLRSDGSLAMDERRFNEDGSFIGQYSTLEKPSGTLQNGNYQPVREAL